MRQILYIVAIAALFWACNQKDDSRPADEFYMPAEWEPHDAIWLG